MEQLEESSPSDLTEPDLEPEVFVPDHALQGSELPVHVMWSSGAMDMFEISGVGEVIEEHNIAKSTHRDGTFNVTDIEYPGYVGLVLGTEVREQAEYEAVYEFSISIGGREYSSEQEVYLYRPEVAIELAETNLVLDITDEGPSFDKEVILENRGKGSALVRVDILAHGTDDSLLEAPYEIEAFREGMKQDLQDRMPSLVEAHPNRKDLLKQFTEIFFRPFSLDESDQLETADRYLSDLVVAMENDEEFGRDLAAVTAWAFANNLELVTIVDQFVDYLESVGGNKVFLINPIDTFYIGEGLTKVDVKVTYTDAVYNEYDPIILEGVAIESAEEIELPVHQIIDFEERNDG